MLQLILPEVEVEVVAFFDGSAKQLSGAAPGLAFVQQEEKRKENGQNDCPEQLKQDLQINKLTGRAARTKQTVKLLAEQAALARGRPVRSRRPL